MNFAEYNKMTVEEFFDEILASKDAFISNMNNLKMGEKRPDDWMQTLAAWSEMGKEETQSAELDLAYMSIDSMSARIKNLEIDIAELEARNRQMAEMINLYRDDVKSMNEIHESLFER